MVLLGRRLMLLLTLVAGFLLAPALALAQPATLSPTTTPSPTVTTSPGPCTGPGCPHSGSFWIVFVVLVGLLAIYRLWLLRRR